MSGRLTDLGTKLGLAVTLLGLGLSSAAVPSSFAGPAEERSVGDCTVVGTAGDDVLRGTPHDDVICGLGGNDTLWGGRGDDVLRGGAGDDVIRGQQGDDIELGGAGDDRFRGQGGADVLAGGPGFDEISYYGRDSGVTVTIGSGADDGHPGEHDDVRRGTEAVSGTIRADLLVGDSGPNVLRGHGGPDRLLGNDGTDLLVGGVGEDRLLAGRGNDRLSGGLGNDRLDARDSAAYVDRLVCGAGARDVALLDAPDKVDATCERFPLNHPPSDVVLSDAAVAENEPAGTTVGTLSAVDPDAGDVHTFALVAGTGDTDNGSFSIDGDALVTNQPFDFETKASYSVRIAASDGRGGIRTEQFTITVTDVNEDVPPVAVDDAATVAEDAGATTVDVLANDSDVDGGLKTVQSVTQPAHGGVVIATGDTGVDYTPDADYCNSPPGTSPDTFTYTLNGGSTATVSMTVTCVEDAAVAVDDSATVAEDSSANPIDVLANDTDVDGGTKLVESVTQPVDGSVVVTVGGTGVAYSPNPDYCNSPPGTSPDTFTYTLNGGSTATVSVTVTCSGDAPVVASAAGALAYTENDPATAIDPSLTVTDADAGGTITGATVQITGNYAGTQDVLALAGSHAPITGVQVGDTLTLTGTTSVAAYQAALRDVTYRNASDDPDTATRTVTFTVTDDTALSGSDTHGVTVSAVDDAPVAVDDTTTVGEDSGTTVVLVLTNDTDVDTGPIAVASVTQPANGSAVNNGTDVSYTPNADYCNTGPGGSPDTFTYTLTPGGSTATVSVTVTCSTDVPDVTTSGGSLAYTENDPATPIDAGVTVTDPDGGAMITGATVAITTNYAGAEDVLALTGVHAPITALQTGDTLTLSGTATPAAYQAALRDVTYLDTSEGPSALARTVTFTVTDDSALSDSATRTITVAPVNDPPAAVDDSGTTDEDTPLNVSAPGVLANDTDVDPGDTKTVVQLNGSATLTGTSTEGGSVTINADGSWSYTPPAAFQALSTGESDTDSFTYTMADGSGAQSTATVNLTVNGVSDAPTAVADSFDAIGNTGLFVGTTRPASQAGKEITGSLLANDTDPDTPQGNLVVEPVTDAPTTLGGTITIESDGNFTYLPDDGDVGATDTFTYRVCDASPCNSGTVANATGTLSLPITGQVWYVRNDEPAGGDGTSDTPFDTLAEAETASSTGDTVFVFDGDNTTANLDTGYAMAANERLIGESRGLSLDPDGGGPLPLSSLHPGTVGAQPTLTASNEDVIALASGATVDGVDVDPSGTGGGISGGAGTSSVTIDHVNVTDTGTPGTQPGLELDGTTGTNTVSNLTVTTGGSATAIGVRLNNAGTVSFSSAGTISITTSGAKALDATGTSLGAGSQFDSITVTGSASGALSMVNTTGTTSFVDLSLATTAGSPAAFLLNNAGTITMNPAGTATVSAPGAPGIDVSGTSNPTLSFDTVSASPATGTAISLAGLGTGTFGAGGGTISGGTGGNALSVNGGSGNVTYDGAVADGSGGTALVTARTGGVVTMSGTLSDGPDANGGIAVTSNSGGSTVFSGGSKTFTTGAGNGLTMTSNTGHTVSFTNGGLAITSGSGTGALVSGGGTINVTGSLNTIGSGTGGALLVDNTTIGASDLAFQGISSAGAPAGIRLNATGATGRLVVTGIGGTCTQANTSGCSGGVIANGTGGDDSGATPSGTGIVLNNTKNPSFTRVWVHDHSNYGIRGTAVAGLTVSDSVINATSGTNGTSAQTAFKDGSVRFEELTGTVAMTNTAISNGYFTNLMVDNTTGVLNGTFDNVDSGTLDATGGDDAVQFEGIGSSDLNVDYKNSAITTASGDLFQYIGDGTGGGDLDFTNNTLSNNEPSINTGGGGVALVAGAKGAATMDVLNNTMKDSLTNALTIIKSRDATAGTNDLVANITGNSIGVAGTANSGSIEGDGMEITTFGDGNATFNVTNNDIHQYNSSGIQFVAGSGVVDSGQFNLNISGNTVANPGTNPSITLLQGVRIDSGVAAGDTFATCAKFGPNAITGSSDAANKDFRLVASQSTSIRQPGYPGGATDGPAFAAFAAGLIGGGAQGTAVANAPATFSGSGSTCP
jgi:VCBS repeat-containing protein